MTLVGPFEIIFEYETIIHSSQDLCLDLSQSIGWIIFLNLWMVRWFQTLQFAI